MASNQSVDNFTKDIYKSSNFADLTLRLKDGKELKVHKAIVCRCPFFKAACTSGFKEACENIISFPEAHPAALELVVMCIYGFSIEEGCGEMKADLNVTLLVNAINLAEMYSARWVADTCFQRLETFLENIAKPLNVELLWELAHVVWQVHQPETRLRILLVKTVQKHSNTFATLDVEKFRRMYRFPGLMYDLHCRGGLDGKAVRPSSRREAKESQVIDY